MVATPFVCVNIVTRSPECPLLIHACFNLTYIVVCKDSPLDACCKEGSTPLGLAHANGQILWPGVNPMATLRGLVGVAWALDEEQRS